MKKIILLICGILMAAYTLQAQTPLSKCPKHFVQIFQYTPAKFTLISANPDFQGLLIILPWKSVEFQKDTYYFGWIDSILNEAEKYHKKVIFQFQYKTFQGKAPIVPDYLLQDSLYHGGVAYAPDSSSVAKLWIPAVVDRLDTVLQAMANHFGSHPALEGINFNETATYGWWLPEYHVHDFMNGIMSNIAHARAAFPDSVFIIQYLNWLPGSGPLDSLKKNLRIIAEFTTHLTNTGFGGPDNKIQHNPPYTKLFPFQHEYDGKAVLMNATQWSDYGYINPNTNDTVTAAEILQYSVDSLKDDYVVWLERAPFFIQDVIPTLALYRGLCSDSLNTGQITHPEPINCKISPNPAHDILLISGECPPYTSYSITDLSGRLMQSGHGRSRSIRIQDLPEAYYLLNLYDNKRHLMALPFFKMH